VSPSLICVSNALESFEVEILPVTKLHLMSEEDWHKERLTVRSPAT
jgi:hypothetical protein